MNMTHNTDDTLIEGLARVVAVDNAQVWLSAEQPASCGSCATRSACGSGAARSTASWRVPRSLGPGLAPLTLGDTVRIGVDRSALNRASLSAFALPLGTMLIAAIGMQDAGDGVAIAAALVGLLVGVAMARWLTRRWRDALVPVVLGRAQDSTSTACTPPGSSALRHIAIPVIQRRSH